MRAPRQIRRSRDERLPRGAHWVCAVLAALLAGAGLALAGCDADGSDDEWEPKQAVVEVMRVDPEVLIDVAVFSGQLDAEHSVRVRPEIQGVIESIDFEQGQSVVKDDVLFHLRSREQAARLREAQANRNLARVRWDRAKQLLSRDASSRAAADVVQAEYQVAEARVELARVEVERTWIRAPFDGIVGQRFVDIGEQVDDETDLVQLDAVDRLQLTFGITDQGLPFAKPGMKIEAWVRPYPGERFSGEVFFVSPTLDPSNRRIWAKAWIDNQERRLAPGLFANVDLELRRVEAAIVVPESAIAIDRQGPHVWKIDDENRARRLPVEIGLRERGIVEVLQGLPAGTRVVTAGTHKVSEGKVVKIADRPLVERALRTPPEGALIGEGT